MPDSTLRSRFRHFRGDLVGTPASPSTSIWRATHPALSYAGTWSLNTSNWWIYANQEQISSSSGNRCVIAFEGTRCRIFGAKGADRGIVAIYLDGALTSEVDLYEADQLHASGQRVTNRSTWKTQLRRICVSRPPCWCDEEQRKILI